MIETRSKPTNELRGNRVIDKERQLYVVQKLNPYTGGWETVRFFGGQTITRIVGRSAAYRIQQELLERDPDNQYRAMDRQTADQYLAGWRQALEYARTGPRTKVA